MHIHISTQISSLVQVGGLLQCLSMICQQIVVFIQPLIYQIINISTENMRGHYDHPDSSQKDVLIATMRKQLHDLKQLNHEHLALIDEVKNVQSRHNLLEDENNRLDSQYKTKSDLNRKVINQLRNEADNLKIQIHKCSVNIDDIMRENANLRRVCDNRDNQITNQLGVNQELQKNNYDQNESNQNLSMKIKSLKEERYKCEQDYERLKKTLDEQIMSLKGLEKEARHVESNNNKFDNIIHIAERDNEGLVEDLKSREEKVSATNIKLKQLKDQRMELKDKTSKLQKECIRSETDLRNVTNDLDNAINKNRQISKRIKNQENVQRTSENQLEKSKIQREALNKEYLNLDAEDKVLNGEIDRCLMSVIQYEKINEELLREIQHFMACDEQARTMLNRRQALKNLHDQVANKLQKTSNDIAHLR